MFNKEKAVHIIQMKAVLQSVQIQSAIDRFNGLCCNASECDEQHSSDIRRYRWRIDFKISELVELTRCYLVMF